MLEHNIPRCFDSHVHWAYTGEKLREIDLRELTDPKDLAQVKIKPENYRGEWLCGFGWDESKWKHPNLPSRRDLDAIFPDMPVYFVRADGHAAWLNTKALELLGYLHPLENLKYSSMIYRDGNGLATGIVVEAAAIDIGFKLPKPTLHEMKQQLILAMRLFNNSGYKYIREMTASKEIWFAARELEKENRLSVCAEMNFICESVEDLPRVISEAKSASEEGSKYLRVAGLKIFLDGSLGSETAYLSRNYEGSSQRGLLLFQPPILREILRQTWAQKLPISVHCIGDATAEILVQTALEIPKDQRGKLHVEHAQVVRPETLDKFENLDVHFHMQPIHFLTDRSWLRKKLGPLYQFAFPWFEIEKRGFALSFGSDSPIEGPSLHKIPEALALAEAEGIRSVQCDFTKYCSHPDDSWTV